MEPPLVLVPVNQFDRAKGRLAELLEPEERVAIAEATLRTVVEAVQGAGWALTILTADERARCIAGEWPRIIEEDPSVRGLNPQLEAALRKIQAPAGGVLILHADLPLATAAALRAVAEAAPPAPSAVLVRSGDGGTNAMLLRPPGRFPLAYGASSFERHCTAAHAAGIQVHVVESEALALDLDTPADLETVLSRPGAEATRAGRLLADWHIAERMATR